MSPRWLALLRPAAWESCKAALGESKPFATILGGDIMFRAVPLAAVRSSRIVLIAAASVRRHDRDAAFQSEPFSCGVLNRHRASMHQGGFADHFARLACVIFVRRMVARQTANIAFGIRCTAATRMAAVLQLGRRRNRQ
ncbi:hypothetical protein Rcae01_01902 [Novipirellula caenicola]|uniref:Uncharacterized protein n=1 Tax=Novipirellula caenicola TaxID=1536901 RepID=A0ABP9VMN0_9BACT